jgi:thioesterase domain-containing protein
VTLPDDRFAWSERWWCEWTERAAIVQYDGGHPRAEAERLAEAMVREMATLAVSEQEA